MGVQIKVCETAEAASKMVSDEIISLIKCNHDAVLGLIAGKTPVHVYKNLVEAHQKGLSFANVCTFNQDEYLGIPATHPQTFSSFMRQNITGKTNILAGNVHSLPSEISVTRMGECIKNYEEAMKASGGIDYMMVSMSHHGHLGFNEPNAPVESRTRRVHLDSDTRDYVTPYFGDLAHVPHYALTVGIGTMMEAKKIAVMAFGTKKANVIRRILKDPISTDLTATYLRNHPGVTVYLDQAAASQL